MTTVALTPGTKIRLLTYGGKKSDYSGTEGRVEDGWLDLEKNEGSCSIIITKAPPGCGLSIGSRGRADIRANNWQIEIISDEWDEEENSK